MIEIGGKIFDTTNQTFIMGILNITPDSFCDGGRFNTLEKALKQAEKLVNDGASIIDIGAESTRPGFEPVSTSEELRRIDNLIFKIKKNFDNPISIDTTKPEVAKFALQQGAALINDISGLENEELAKTAAEFDAAYCLMHNKKIKNSSNFLNELIGELELKLKIAQNCGIKKTKIIVDPGIGFNKTFKENWLALKSVLKLAQLECPVLVGASNKSFIGKAVDEPDAKHRLGGTVATTTIAALFGAGFVRVHDVKPNFQALKIAKLMKTLEYNP